MRRILSQRETFAYRLAADNPYMSSDNPQKKKEDYFGLDIPGMEKANLDTPAGGGGSADRYNQQAAEEESGPAGTSGRMQKMTITPGGGGRGGGGGSNSSGSSGYQGNGQSGRDGLNPGAMAFYDQLAKDYPGASMGGFNPVVDQPWDEHATGDALDFMTSDLAQGNAVRDRALENGAKHVIWQQKLWYPGGRSEAMENRGSPTENHYDHVHINMGH